MEGNKFRSVIHLTGLVFAGILLSALLLGAAAQSAQRLSPGSLSALAAEPAALTRYVAKTGSDAGPNTCLNPAAPCLTVGYAISQAQDNDAIQVAQGVYTENLELPRPLTLLGGFEAAGWTRDIAAYETTLDGSNSRDIIGDWDGSQVYFPTVISETLSFKMWYVGWSPWDRAIGLAESPDGESWTKYAGNPIFRAGSDWDWRWRIPAAVIYEGGLYKMWYSGRGDNSWQTGYATSNDGIAWDFYAGNPVLPVGPAGAWDAYKATNPEIIHDGSTYKMWYTGCPVNGLCGIGYATSPDGLTWTKYPGNPVITSTGLSWDGNTYSRPAVIKNGATYQLWYDRENVIHYATSPDGITWTKYPGNPVLAADWEGKGVSIPDVILDHGVYRMWFTSDYSDSFRIGYATSPDGITWTMPPINPVLAPGAPSYPSVAVVRVYSPGSGSTIDGFTIQNGEGCNGGGISVEDAQVTITHNVIQKNKGIHGCAGGGVGVASSNGSILLEHNLIQNNWANDGGGVAVLGSAHATIRYTDIISNSAPGWGWGGGGLEAIDWGSSALVENSQILSNTIENYGGGVFIQEGNSIIIRSSTIGGNFSSDLGGGITNFGELILEDSTVQENEAVNHGGGIFTKTPGITTIRRSYIKANTAGSQGGGAWTQGDTTVTDSGFFNNTSAGQGGGLAPCCDDGSGGTLVMTNTIVAQNQASGAGGIGPFWRGTLTNVTVADNTCTDPDCNGGIYAPQDQLNSPHTLVNSIAYFNTNDDFDCFGDCTVSYNDVEQGVLPGPGNISSNPSFVDPSNWDYHLQNTSPCVDAGTAVGAPDHDFEGDPRPVNAGFDIGYDEVAAPPPAGPVVIRLIPATDTMYVGQDFALVIQVEAGAQPLDGAAAYINFDPSVMQVSSIIPGSALPITLQNDFDNTFGWINFSAGTLSTNPSGIFTLATVHINPIATTPGTSLNFHYIMPRQTDATYQGGSVLHHAEGAQYDVRDDAIINGHVSLQGRPTPPNPRWITPLTLGFTLQGQVAPGLVVNTTTGDLGDFLLEGIPPAVYTITVKNSHTLANAIPASLAFGPNTIDFGTLREGDADDDNCVVMVDFSILATSFGKGQGTPGYDDRADFNEDTFVTLQDFSLLATNFGVCGDGPQVQPVTPEQPDAAGGNIRLVLVPDRSVILPGQEFTVMVVAQAGSSKLDGAAVHLDFDPLAIQVVDLTGNQAAFPKALLSRFDNHLGTLDYAAGTLVGFPDGEIEVLSIRFQAMPGAAGARLSFSLDLPRRTDLTFGGASVLGGADDLGIAFGNYQNKLVLPLVLR